VFNAGRNGPPLLKIHLKNLVGTTCVPLYCYHSPITHVGEYYVMSEVRFILTPHVSLFFFFSFFFLNLMKLNCYEQSFLFLIVECQFKCRFHTSTFQISFFTAYFHLVHCLPIIVVSYLYLSFQTSVRTSVNMISSSALHNPYMSKPFHVHLIRIGTYNMFVQVVIFSTLKRHL